MDDIVRAEAVQTDQLVDQKLDQVDQALAPGKGEVTLGATVNMNQALATVDYQQRFNQNVSAFATAYAGMTNTNAGSSFGPASPFGGGGGWQPDVGAVAGIRFQW